MYGTKADMAAKEMKMKMDKLDTEDRLDSTFIGDELSFLDPSIPVLARKTSWGRSVSCRRLNQTEGPWEASGDDRKVKRAESPKTTKLIRYHKLFPEMESMPVEPDNQSKVYNIRLRKPKSPVIVQDTQESIDQPTIQTQVDAKCWI
jgi:hypothetical protein